MSESTSRERLEFVVQARDEGRRLDVVLARVARLSRAAAARLVDASDVLVSGRPGERSTRLRSGDVVSALLPEPPRAPGPEVHAVRVVYEDAALLVVSKPPGLVVHPAPGRPSGTLVNALLARAGRPAGGPSDRPGIVHRLDAGTSGLLIVAKSPDAYRAFVRMMAARSIERAYLAAVEGTPATDTGTVDAPVGRSPQDRRKMAVVAGGRPAVTHFSVVERLGRATLLKARLETGRTHQIRVHFAAAGMPVLGDRLYGRDRRLAEAAGLARPFLHAGRLEFDHPLTGEKIALEDPLPPDLATALEALRRLG